MFGGIFRGRRILITGDTGFKGSWLATWLHGLGAEVYGYALPPRSLKDNYVRSGLAHIIHHQDGDIRDLEAMKSFFRSVEPDMAFHLAAQPLVLYSYADPVETFSTNTLGTVHFFECLRATPSVKVAVNISSDKCYENREWVWGYRENDAMGGKDPYSASKGCAELIFSSYLHSFFNQPHTCSVASGRAGNVIGGGDWAENRIIPDVFRACEAETPVLIRNPHSTRPWQFVLEPLFGYLRLAQRMWEGAGFTGGWNFGPLDNNSYSVKDLLDRVKARIPALQIQFPDEAPALHEAALLKLDISKAVSRLGWRPLLDFESTVDFTVEGYLDESRFVNRTLFEARLRQIEAYTARATPHFLKA